MEGELGARRLLEKCSCYLFGLIKEFTNGLSIKSLRASSSHKLVRLYLRIFVFYDSIRTGIILRFVA